MAGLALFPFPLEFLCTFVHVFAQGVNLDAFASVAETEQIAESLSANRSSSISGSDNIGHTARNLLQALLLMRLRAVNGPVGDVYVLYG